jgi:hypothetical protein
LQALADAPDPNPNPDPNTTRPREAPNNNLEQDEVIAKGETSVIFAVGYKDHNNKVAKHPQGGYKGTGARFFSMAFSLQHN